MFSLIYPYKTLWIQMQIPTVYYNYSHTAKYSRIFQTHLHQQYHRYPCISPRAEYVESKVYSGTLACCRFLYGDRSVVTVGGTDASLMVWELVEE